MPRREREWDREHTWEQEARKRIALAAARHATRQALKQAWQVALAHVFSEFVDALT